MDIGIQIANASISIPAHNCVKAFETSDLKDKLARYHGENTETVFSRWADRWLAPEFYDWNIEEYLSRIECPADASAKEKLTLILHYMTRFIRTLTD